MFTIRRRCLSAVAALALLTGCSAQHAPQPPLVDACVRVDLEPSPLWTASAAWDADEEHLLVYDPGTSSLAVYNAFDGSLERRVDDGPIAELNPSTPIRIHRTADGFVVGDRERLLWLGEDLRPTRKLIPFEALAATGAHDGGYSDFAFRGNGEPDDEWLLYADYLTGEDSWHRGFFRARLSSTKAAPPLLAPVLELALDETDMANYYIYHQRPYISRLGDRFYVLRYTDPARIHRVRRGGLEVLPEIPDPDFDAVALYAAHGRLFLLMSRYEETDEVADDGIQDAELLEESVRNARVQSEKIRRSVIRPRTWILVELDPKSGAEKRRFLLPTTAQRLQAVPGARHWALIEETGAPNMGEADRTRLFVMPSRLLSGATGHEVTVDCGERN